MSWFFIKDRTRSSHCETKIRSKDPKDGVFTGFLYVLKTERRGHDRHSKNGLWARIISLMELSFDSIQTPTLTKAELAELLYEQLGLNKREAKNFVDEFFEVITQRNVSRFTSKL